MAGLNAPFFCLALLSRLKGKKWPCFLLKIIICGGLTADLILPNFPAAVHTCTSKSNLILKSFFLSFWSNWTNLSTVEHSSSDLNYYLSFEGPCLKFRPRWKQPSAQLYLGEAVSSHKSITQRRLLSVSATWEGSENIWIVDQPDRAERHILSFQQKCLL